MMGVCVIKVRMLKPGLRSAHTGDCAPRSSERRVGNDTLELGPSHIPHNTHRICVSASSPADSSTVSSLMLMTTIIQPNKPGWSTNRTRGK